MRKASFLDRPGPWARRIVDTPKPPPATEELFKEITESRTLKLEFIPSATRWSTSGSASALAWWRPRLAVQQPCQSGREPSQHTAAAATPRLGDLPHAGISCATVA